jgi:multiple sugar transport system permease protein
MKKAQQHAVFKRSRASKIISFIFCFFFSFLFLVPLLWIFVSAFKVDREIYQAGGFLLFPKTWTVQNFVEILDPKNKQLPIFRWYGNSIIISVTHSVLAVLIYSLSAYAYAKLKFKGRDVIFLTLLFLASFPAIINIIPLYKVMLRLQWLNKPMALIFPGLSGMFNIFLIRQFMYGVPDSYMESARIDGSGDGRIFLFIVLPLIKPILTAVALFSFIGNWNDFLWPSIAMNNVDNLTLTAGLQLVKGIYGSSTISKLSAVGVIAVLPMMILYLFTQRFFINGISISSGVKG